MSGESNVFDLVKRFFVGIGRRSEALFDAARFRIKVRLGRLERIEVLPYRGHGNENEVFLKGRVLEESGVTPSTHTDHVLRNFKNMARRFFSSEAPHAVVRASFGGRDEIEVEADAEGFFDVRLEVPGKLSDDFEWHPVMLRLVSPLAPGQRGDASKGWVLVPDASTEFAVISDIDDTVMLSKAASVLRMAWIVALGNAHSRIAFEGVGALYDALRRGRDGAKNPVFYVSSSPWNIYDLLTDFMDVHGLPPGPIFLKDWSPTVLGKHEDHKLTTINTLLETYPNLPFVLMGDSGQKDPEIYARAAEENPSRIAAVYIRDVTGSERRREVEEIIANLAVNVPMKLARDSGDAAEHALALGLVSPESARRVFANLP